DIKPGKQDMADHLPLVHGHQFQHRVAGTDQRVDEAGLGLLAEGMLLDAPDRVAVGRRGRAYRHHAHDSLVPSSILAPRRKSGADAGLPPARCSSTSLTAPVPQATARRPSMI